MVIHWLIVFGVVAVCVGSAITLLKMIYEWVEGLWRKG
jgi:hypothetical protein